MFRFFDFGSVSPKILQTRPHPSIRAYHLLAEAITGILWSLAGAHQDYLVIYIHTSARCSHMQPMICFLMVSSHLNWARKLGVDVFKYEVNFTKIFSAWNRRAVLSKNPKLWYLRWTIYLKHPARFFNDWYEIT